MGILINKAPNVLQVDGDDVTAATLGLSHVDDTADADKPISDDTQDALDALDVYTLNISAGGISQPITASGWIADTIGNILFLDQSKSAKVLDIHLPPLKVGQTIKSFSLIGGLDGSGGSATITAVLKRVYISSAYTSLENLATLNTITATATATDLNMTTAKKDAINYTVLNNETFMLTVTSTTSAGSWTTVSGVALELT